MDITYEIMKNWIGDDVRVYFNTMVQPLQGKMCEISTCGMFVLVEGFEFFVPFANMIYAKHIKEPKDDETPF